MSFYTESILFPLLFVPFAREIPGGMCSKTHIVYTVCPRIIGKSFTARVFYLLRIRFGDQHFVYIRLADSHIFDQKNHPKYISGGAPALRCIMVKSTGFSLILYLLQICKLFSIIIVKVFPFSSKCTWWISTSTT